MGAGASLSKVEAEAAAPENGAAFSDAAWDELDKDAEGKCSSEVLKGAASKYAIEAKENGAGAESKDEAAAVVGTPRSQLMATKLQASARGQQERKNPSKPPEKTADKQDRMAAKLQAGTRGHQERCHPTPPPAKTKKPEAAAADADALPASSPETDQAASKLQARMRGKNERANPTKPPEKTADVAQGNAAAKMQAKVRGDNERKHPTPPPEKTKKAEEAA